jgi:GTPase involved in cell partitioning and DNA repair
MESFSFYFYILTILSNDVEAISLPSGGKSTVVTSLESSLSVASKFRFFTSYSMAVMLLDNEVSSLLSGERPIALTLSK